MKANKKTKVTIEGANPRLTELLKNYQLKNFETRDYSTGKGMLYIRLAKIVPTVKLDVA